MWLAAARGGPSIMRATACATLYLFVAVALVARRWALVARLARRPSLLGAAPVERAASNRAIVRAPRPVSKACDYLLRVGATTKARRRRIVAPARRETRAWVAIAV